MDKLHTTYKIRAVETPHIIEFGQWQGVPCIHLVPGPSHPVDTLVETAQGFHHTHISFPPDENLDGLLVPLHAQGHFVSIHTFGTQPVRGTVAPDWITVHTNTQTAESINSDILLQANEYIWECESWSDAPRLLMEEIITQTTKLEKPKIPVFFFNFHTENAARGFDAAFLELPYLVQSFWRTM